MTAATPGLSPGPWSYRRHDLPAGDGSLTRALYSVVDAGGALITLGIKSEANARAMAANPELLDAARQLLDTTWWVPAGNDQEQDATDRAMSALRAAVAKATVTP